MSPRVIALHFFGYKNPVLWFAGSLRADVNPVGTKLEDPDSPLDNGIAEVSLGVHL